MPPGPEAAQSVALARPGPRAVPDVVWAPLAAGVLTLLPGLLGLAAGKPWLFPSLAPTAFLQAAQPQLPSARFLNTLVGHLLAAAAGFGAVLLLGAAAEPSVLAAHEPQPLRTWASALAVAVLLLAQVALRLPHPPAAATALLVTLGGFGPTGQDAAVLLAGVLTTALAGGLLRRLRLAQPGQK